MRIFNSHVAALPRVMAERSLQLAAAAAAAWGGDGGRDLLRGWQSLVDGNAPRQRRDRLEGPSLLALLKDTNDKARAEGMLWEQRVAAAERPSAPAWKLAGA